MLHLERYAGMHLWVRSDWFGKSSQHALSVTAPAQDGLDHTITINRIFGDLDT